MHSLKFVPRTTNKKQNSISTCGPATQLRLGKHLVELTLLVTINNVSGSIMVETDQKAWKRRKITELYKNPYNDMPLLIGKLKSPMCKFNY